MKRMLCLVVLLLSLLPIWAQNGLIRNFKLQFKSMPKALQSTDVFVKQPPAMLLSGRQLDDHSTAVGHGFYVFNEDAKALRGKYIKATFKIQRLSGTVPLQAEFRVFGNGNHYMGGRAFDFDPAIDGKWHEATISFSVPDLDGIENVNVRFGFRQDGETPNIYAVDELTLSHASDSGIELEPADSLGVAQLTANREPLKLVANGIPQFTIVLSNKPNEVAEYAANELREHVRLTTGKTVPIVKGEDFKGVGIHIGDTPLSRRYGVAPDMMAPDCYVLARVGQQLLISGGDGENVTRSQILSRATIPIGTLFATYEFLERYFDVRWFWPGPRGMVVPPAKNVTLTHLFISGVPVYSSRSLFYDISKDKDIPPLEVVKWQRRIRLGGADPDPIGMHAFHNWWKIHGDEPELFALQIDGKRKVDGESGAHLCLTNPRVVELSAQAAIDFFKADPRRKFFSVMPGDSNDLHFCRCARCQKTVSAEKGPNGKHSNAVWAYVNAVAARVAKEMPGKFIKCCAYADYLRRPDFLLMPNIAVTLCYGTVPQGSRNYKEDWRKLIDEWRSTGAALYIWEYWNNSRDRRGIYGAPAVYPRQLKEIYAIDRGQVSGRVMELADVATDGTAQQSWADWVYDMPNLYMAGKLMWNIDLDVEDELDRFYRQFYGPAEKPMREFFDTLEIAWTKSTWKANGKALWDHETCWGKTYPPALVDKLMGLLREAVRLCGKQEPYAYRAQKTLESYLPFERNSLTFRASKRALNPSQLSIPQAAAPVLDGRLDAAEWQDGTQVGNFTDSYNVYPITGDTQLYFKHDASNLYVGVKATAPADGRDICWSSAEWGKRDAMLWDAESLELLFAGTDGEIAQFIVAPDNKLFDAWWPVKVAGQDDFPLGEATKWNPQVKMATQREGNTWSAEIAIPLAAFVFKHPLGAKQLKANFARNHRYYPAGSKSQKWEQAMWLPTYGSFHKYEKYGVLTLQDKP